MRASAKSRTQVMIPWIYGLVHQWLDFYCKNP